VKLRGTPPLTDVEEALIAAALARAGIRLDGEPDSYGSRWRRTGVEEALDETPREGTFDYEAFWRVYTASPRSTLGATRA
jgi:hypothetical protein